MSREHIELYKKVKKFTRLGKKDPKDLVASDWSLFPTGGYNDAYAMIHSETLGLTLSYGPNSYPLTDFMNNDIIHGRLDLCKNEDKKAILSIDNEFELVFTSVGLIPSFEYYEALDRIELFETSEKLTLSELEEGKIYISIDEKIFVYLGFETLSDGTLSTSPKIQEVISKYLWDTTFRGSYLTVKNPKGLGKTLLSHEITTEDFSDRSWTLQTLNNFKAAVATRI